MLTYPMSWQTDAQGGQALSAANRFFLAAGSIIPNPDRKGS
jgi:hypothetical protein